MAVGVTLICGNCPDTPVPFRVTLWGLPLALSAVISVACRGPAAVGLKITGIRAVALAATLMGDAGVGGVKVGGKAKSPGLAPPMDTPVISSVAEPVFLAVTESAVLVV